MTLIRLASALVLAAIVVELGSLGWSHPLSFILFACAGGAALAAGLLIYFYWLVVGRPDEVPPNPRTKD
jgi:hypothetical protein